MVLGLAPFETYYNGFIDPVQCQPAWSRDKQYLDNAQLKSNSDKGEPRQTAYCSQCTSLTYRDCSIGLGFIGTDCNTLDREGEERFILGS